MACGLSVDGGQSCLALGRGTAVDDCAPQLRAATLGPGHLIVSAPRVSAGAWLTLASAPSRH